MTSTIPRLKALRHSHCDTCGCNRCKWIDAALAGSNDRMQLSTEENLWLVEGVLSMDEKGGLNLEREGCMISLTEALAGRLGHYVLVLVGSTQEQAIGGER